MKRLITIWFAFFILVACSPPTAALSETPLDAGINAKYMSCDRDPPDEISNFSLANIDPENVRFCLIASAGVGEEPGVFGAAYDEERRCSTLPSRQAFRVRSGVNISLEVARSYEFQKAGSSYPNARNFSFTSFAQPRGQADQCILVPWLTASVPYIAIEDQDDNLLSVMVYFPQMTEQYLAEFGFDIEVDMEAAAIAFSALMEH